MLLDGYRVLDLTDHRGELGPWLLGRLGAEIIKVEPPGGSAARHEHPLLATAPEGLQSLQFAAYNDNKQSIVLDLAGSLADRATLLDLIAGSEFVFESGPPGTLAAAGINAGELLAANPELIHVLVTPFGSDGPRADQPASDLTLAALGGPMSIQGVRHRAPVQVSVPQAWRHAGAEAASAAMAGLHRMQCTGEAQWIDVSAQAAMTWTMLNAMEAGPVQGFDFERAGATLKLTAIIDLRRRSKDGFTICAPTGAATRPIVAWLIEEGIVEPSWADEVWATFDHRVLSGQQTSLTYQDLQVALDELCSRYTRDELMLAGLRYGATLAPVNDIADLLGIEHLDVRHFWVAVELPGSSATIQRPGGPVTVGTQRPDNSTTVPLPDAHGPALRATPRRTRRVVTKSGGRRNLPLAGLKVADFSWIGVGPITAKALADHGATVVRIESERRVDGLRLQPPFKDAQFGLNRSNFYGSFNTSKLGLALDLTKPQGVEVARRMTRWADVVIDSFRPGVMDKLGLDHDAIAADNPSIITVTTSLLASGGPLSNLAGYGFHAGALAGFTALTGWPDLGPDGPWMAYTDTIAPRFLTATILAALDRRNRTGEGVQIEGSQLEIALQLLTPELLEYQLTGSGAQRNGNRSRSMAPQGAYACSGEDQWCALTVPDDAGWAALRHLLGDPLWAQPIEYRTTPGRLAADDEIDRHLSAWTASRTAEVVEVAFRSAGLPAGKVQRSSDLPGDPQYRHRHFHRYLRHSEVGEVPYSGHQYRIGGYDNGPRFAAPCLGEHTQHVLSDLLGMTDDEILEVAAADALV